MPGGVACAGAPVCWTARAGPPVTSPWSTPASTSAQGMGSAASASACATGGSTVTTAPAMQTEPVGSRGASVTVHTLQALAWWNHLVLSSLAPPHACRVQLNSMPPLDACRLGGRSSFGGEALAQGGGNQCSCGDSSLASPAATIDIRLRSAFNVQYTHATVQDCQGDEPLAGATGNCDLLMLHDCHV